jgi:hypothetical protein
MAKTPTDLDNDKGDEPKWKTTPNQWFERYVIEVTPHLPAVDRCLLRIKLMSRKEPYWETPANQVKRQKVKIRDVRRARSIARHSGGWRKITYKEHKALERVNDDDKETNRIFHSHVGLKMNVETTIIDIASKTPDGRVKISMGKMAKQFNTHRDYLVQIVEELEADDLLKVERRKGAVNIYSLPGVKRTESSAKKVAGLTSQEVIEQSGFVPRVVETFTKDLIPGAKRLKLIDMADDAILTARVVELYHAIKLEREAANLDSNLKIRIGGPLEILRQYLAWLAKKDWEASSRVLKPESPAFAQFRRDFRELEQNDPINGKARVYD